MESPFAREPFELVRAAIFELDARRRGERLRQIGDEDLVGAGLPNDARGLVYRDTPHASADELDFAPREHPPVCGVLVELPSDGSLAHSGALAPDPRRWIQGSSPTVQPS